LKDRHQNLLRLGSEPRPVAAPHLPVHHRRTNRPFRQAVGGRNLRMEQEANTLSTWASKAQTEVGDGLETATSSESGTPARSDAPPEALVGTGPVPRSVLSARHHSEDDTTARERCSGRRPGPETVVPDTPDGRTPHRQGDRIKMGKLMVSGKAGCAMVRAGEAGMSEPRGWPDEAETSAW